MLATIKTLSIKPLPGDFFLIDFSSTHKIEGLLKYKNKLWPVPFSNETSGQLLVNNQVIFLENQTIEVELVNSFVKPPPAKKKILIMASGLGIGYALFLAKKWKNLYPLVLLGVEKTFPFALTPSKFLVKESPAFVTAGVKLLEDLGIVSRLATEIEQPGCFHGSVSELAEYFLKYHTDYELYHFLGTI